MTERVGGIRSVRPTMSVRKPGVIKKRSAEDHEHPVEHLAVRHPALREVVVEAPQTARPWTEQQRSQQRVRRTSSRRGPQDPDRVTHLIDDVQLRDRDQQERRASAQRGTA